MRTIKGINPVLEAINSNKNIEKIEIYKNINKKTITKILEYCSKKNIKIFYTNKRYENSQGIMAYISEYDYYKPFEECFEKSFTKDKSIILILDQIQDPRNFGSIIRTAECFGVDFIIIQDRNNATVTETVVKTATGAIEYVPIVKVVNISEIIKKLQKYGYIVYGAEANGDLLYTDIKESTKTVLVVGSEGNGLRQKVRNSCDNILKIPLKGNINSLNVSVATGILLSKI